VPRIQDAAGSIRESLKNRLIAHRIYTRTHGEDMPEIRDWVLAPRPESG
jgi:xylulose-5-phosphate/fructose-6-phosphate phosphoketolase